MRFNSSNSQENLGQKFFSQIHNYHGSFRNSYFNNWNTNEHRGNFILLHTDRIDSFVANIVMTLVSYDKYII